MRPSIELDLREGPLPDVAQDFCSDPNVRGYYSDIERGTRNVSLVNIEKIAKGLRRSLP